MIQLENVKIGYATALAEVRVSQLEKGKMYALIGSNGSGKSTFLRTICGRQQPIEGSIHIGGNNVVQLNQNELAKQVAFVPSKFPEADFMSVFDFIALGRTPYLNSIGRLSEEDFKVVQNVIDHVQIQHLQAKRTNELSDGERQLCAVARALAQQTPIILLDEPTGFLDYRNKRRLLALLEKLTSEMQLTILFSTHDIESIFPLEIQLLGITAGSVRKLETIDKTQTFESIIERYYI